MDRPLTFARLGLDLGARAVEIGAGGSHTCALLDDGSVRCWGDNRDLK